MRRWQRIALCSSLPYFVECTVAVHAPRRTRQRSLVRTLSKPRCTSKLSLVACAVAHCRRICQRHVVALQRLQKLADWRRVVKLVASVENVGKRVAAPPVEIKRQRAAHIVTRLVSLLVVIASFASLPLRRRARRVTRVAVQQRCAVCTKVAHFCKNECRKMGCALVSRQRVLLLVPESTRKYR